MRVIWPSVIGLVMPLYAVAAEPAQTSWATEICQHFRRNEDWSWAVTRPFFKNRFSLMPGMTVRLTDKSQPVSGLAQWLKDTCW